ncbi:hypothetical protein Bpfe_031117 [Biomphalaria pfeifferi]|uniref:Uncharacterized protein n=1 Tax=Biomphalaria pfeifferi TaxID=112525 RepID=A0AAD8ETK3_BIOPF|nr:hypothetical protein Bpfe_031117 [Biomphalaria pfeifferi]
MEVIRLTDESERRFISFHVMPKVEGDPTGFHAIPYMVPPLLDQEVRLYRYYEQVLADQHRHQQTHKLIEEKPHGRVN